VRVLALHLTQPSWAEAKVLGGLLRRLDPGIEVTLITNAAGQGDPASHLADFGSSAVRAHPVDVGLPIDPQTPRPLTTRAAYQVRHRLRWRASLDLAEEFRPDVVYSSQQKFDCRLAGHIADRLGVPQIVHLHYVVGPYLGSGVVARLKSCERVLAVSDFIRSEALRNGVEAARVMTLLNTIDVPPEAPLRDREIPVEPGRMVIGQVGRMVPSKGFRETLLAVAVLREKEPGVKLILVGEGPQRAELEALARDPRLAGAVDFVGWSSDVGRWLRSMDVFAFPSRQEPCAMVVLEASAAGLPVVGYADGGIPELVLDGTTGLLVPPDDVAGLAATFTRLLRDPSLRRKMGEAGRLRMQADFAPEGAGKAFSEHLRSVAARGKVRRSEAVR
jgi:glycosyltransferase involved in cell wall biosynthesis